MARAFGNVATRDGAQRQTFVLACVAHAMHDGFIDGILVFLPIFQTHFGLSYAAVGLLRATATGTMATLQVPAGRLADRTGARWLLAGGTAAAALGYFFASLGQTAIGVFAALALIGVGASVQHPIASELIAASTTGSRRRMALGLYNFMGDVGKTIVPPLAALLVTVLDWRIVCTIICGIGLVVAAGLAARLPRDANSPAGATNSSEDAPHRAPASANPFRVLIAIGILDSAARMAFLTFLPFLLTAKGSALEVVGLALSLLFVGGAVGKFACAWSSTRIGPIATVIVSEGLTSVLVIAVALLPLTAALACLPLLGAALNGTSSVLYGSVAELVPDTRRRHAFAVFYTATVGSGAIAPVLAGVFVDRAGLVAMSISVAVIALAIVPLALGLRRVFVLLDAQAPLSGASTSPVA